MTDTRERLVRCFQAVFPDLNEAEIARASTSRTSAWDSISTLNLTAAVEEEFGMQFAAEEIEKLTSFDAFLSRLPR